MLLKYTRIFKENNPEFIQNQFKIIENYFKDPDFKDKQKILFEHFLIVKHNNPISYLTTNNFKEDNYDYYFEYRIAETVVNKVGIYKENDQFFFELKTILDETLKDLEAILEIDEFEIVKVLEKEEEEFYIDIFDKLPKDFDYFNYLEAIKEHEDRINIEFKPFTFELKIKHLYDIYKFDEEFFKAVEIEFNLVFTQEKRLDFCQGLQLFIIFEDRYVWYSENCPYRNYAEFVPIIQAFERWKFVFEPIFKVNQYFTYDFDDRNYDNPLVFEYISIAQICWYFYNFTESLGILEHSLEQAILYLKNKHNGELPYFQLTELTSEIDSKIWYKPYDFFYFNYLYIAEIYEKLENYEKAIENYENFLIFIPNFKNNLVKNYSKDYFYSCKKVPDTLYISNILKDLYGKVKSEK